MDFAFIKKMFFSSNVYLGDLKFSLIFKYFQIKDSPELNLFDTNMMMCLLNKKILCSKLYSSELLWLRWVFYFLLQHTDNIHLHTSHLSFNNTKLALFGYCSMLSSCRYGTSKSFLLCLGVLYMWSNPCIC